MVEGGVAEALVVRGEGVLDAAQQPHQKGVQVHCESRGGLEEVAVVAEGELFGFWRRRIRHDLISFFNKYSKIISQGSIISQLGYKGNR